MFFQGRHFHATICRGQITVNISRAVSRLKTLFFSFYGGDPQAGMSEYPHDASIATAKRSTAFAVKKESDFFYHPMLGKYQFNKELEYQVQIGSKMVPEYPCRSLAQASYELNKSLGIHGSAWHSVSIS